jgi:hypothetical protein
VLTDPSVDDERATAMGQRLPTLRLRDGTTVEDAMWEMSDLVGKGARNSNRTANEISSVESEQDRSATAPADIELN